MLSRWKSGGKEKDLPLDLLSAGTRDVLSLAVRLGMAAYSLEGNDGFLVMDDPLVNLDPGASRRRLNASISLRATNR